MASNQNTKKIVKQKKSRGEAFWGMVFISPWLIGFLLFTAGPMIISLALSFCRYDLATVKYIGFDNYHRMLAGSETGYFYKSLSNTIIYVLFSVPLGLTGSLLVAMLLNQKVKGIALYRTLFYLPSLVPAVASAIIWLWVFNPDVGIINNFLRSSFDVPTFSGGTISFHSVPLVENPPQWLLSSQWALPSLIIMSLWGIGGSRMIIFLAGLQGVSDEYYEAAKIDGANSWQQFRNITLPLMTPTIFFNMILGIIGAFQVFTQAFVMTNGGPNNATLFYMLYLYRNAFEQLRMGYASALAWVLFIILFIFTFIQFKNSGKWVHYDGDVK